MNYSPVLSMPTAVFLALLAPAMWGSWFICLKYLGKYPLEAFYVTLFATSMLLVWGVGFILDGPALIENMQEVWMEDPSRIIVTIVCGALYVTGMQLSLRIYQIIGLSISQPLQSSINVIIGTLLSALIGGIPVGLTISRIVAATLFLLAALLLTMRAGRLRNAAQKEQNVDTGLSRDPADIRKAIIMLAVGSAFVPAYSTGLSYGLKSITQPNGMAVMPFMSLLCTGAFIGAMLICGTILTKRKQWGVFKANGWKIHKLGVISGLCHYGGNIIHTFATANLSTVVSWPLGLTAGLWTQMWGLKFGEFKGAPKSAYTYLVGGILCYLVGAFLIANIF